VPSAPLAPARPSRARVVAAFAAVYFLWGSTYLAMRVAIETIPALAMAASRFLIAGVILLAWTAWRERPARPSLRSWGWAALTGGLLFVGGNGGVVLAERTVPSGVVALLAATLAIWLVVLDWLRPGGQRPNLVVSAGLALGLVGVGVLVGPGELAGARGVDPFGAALVLGGSLTWAAGSLLSRSRARPGSASLAAAMQMLTGGAMLLAAAAATGDLARLADGGAPSARSLGAVAYLVTAGSLVGFTAYIWLVNHVAPAKVATYAYVNPVVAVLLGWLLLDEPITARTLVASAVIVGAVALVTIGRERARPREASDVRRAA
jgi:drug/metabolite transporter (DMT)-like permease